MKIVMVQEHLGSDCPSEPFLIDLDKLDDSDLHKNYKMFVEETLKNWQWEGTLEQGQSYTYYQENFKDAVMKFPFTGTIVGSVSLFVP